jgi:hypothetical protein
MELKQVTDKMRAQLCKKLPSEAVTPHPTKKYLSSIKSIYVTERLNEVFGVGAWRVKTEVVDKDNKMVVCKVTLTIPDYGIEYECFGGNDNADLGDAYKGATTDALTKIASWMGIGGEVFRGEVGKAKPQPQQGKKRLTVDDLMVDGMSERLCQWLKKNANGQKIADVINHYYDCDVEVIDCITNEYMRLYANGSNNA